MSADRAKDYIDYAKQFSDHVQGRLNARFRVDANGAPIFERHNEDPRLRVYTIDLFLVIPPTIKVKSVRYFMDDDSYLDPEGYSVDANNDFREEITSYGDVEVVVTARMGDDKKYEQRAWLSNMLQNGYVDAKNSAVREAIQRIKAN